MSRSIQRGPFRTMVASRLIVLPTDLSASSSCSEGIVVCNSRAALRNHGCCACALIQQGGGVQTQSIRIDLLQQSQRRMNVATALLPMRRSNEPRRRGGKQQSRQEPSDRASVEVASCMVACIPLQAAAAAANRFACPCTCLQLQPSVTSVAAALCEGRCARPAN